MLLATLTSPRTSCSVRVVVSAVLVREVSR
jgi:hypothetical protein